MTVLWTFAFKPVDGGAETRGKLRPSHTCSDKRMDLDEYRLFVQNQRGYRWNKPENRDSMLPPH